jgi:hypothetical protein
MDSVWHGDEPVAVEAHFLPDGKLRPAAFVWRGRRWTVRGTGRQWTDSDGRHVLVETSDASRFELCLSADGSAWRLRRAWQRPHIA